MDLDGYFDDENEEGDEWTTDEDDEDFTDSDEDMDPFQMAVDNFPGNDWYATESALTDVPMVLPRRIFTGHRNADTVKDCNFVGLRSDKVVSGSDDGNFFVWDKDTGRLEGIWEGDGEVVNCESTVGLTSRSLCASITAVY